MVLWCAKPGKPIFENVAAQGFDLLLTTVGSGPDSVPGLSYMLITASTNAATPESVGLTCAGRQGRVWEFGLTLTPPAWCSTCPVPSHNSHKHGCLTVRAATFCSSVLPQEYALYAQLESAAVMDAMLQA